MNQVMIGALKSKSVWAGLITTVIGVYQYASPFIPPQYLPLATAAAGLLQVGLRTVTTQPLDQK